MSLIYEKIKNYTMCRPERFTRFCQSILDTQNLEGNIIECGVWKGGMSCGAARFLLDNNINKKIYAFDSYEGFPEPTDEDIIAINNLKAKNLENWGMKREGWNDSPLECLYECMNKLNIPNDKIVPVKGWFKDTVPKFDIDKISILRLDGDWYDSTKVCLENLYNKVVSGGIIILDDYGYWKGCKQATDEFLLQNNINITLNKTDFSEVWFIKP
jgi:hypothetical protein